MLWTILFCGLCCLQVSAKKDYTGTKLYSVDLTPEQLQAFVPLIEQNNLDVWSLTSSGHLEVMIEPSQRNAFLDGLQHYNLTATELANVGQLVAVERAHLEASKTKRSPTKRAVCDLFDTFNYGTYHDLHQIEDWLLDVAACPDFENVVTLHVIGSTLEERPIYLLEIDLTPEINKSDVIMMYGIHAREWISPATALLNIYWMLNAPTPTEMEVKWHIIVVENPDGYQYSHDFERLWRKNRWVPTKGKKQCRGVDLNRNWDIVWNGGKKKPGDCNSDVFPGEDPFSEPETVAARDYIANLPNVPLAFFDVHSYSQMILTPYGYKAETPVNYAELEDIGNNGRDAIFDVHGKLYQVGSIQDLLYAVYGGTIDYTLDIENIPYSYGFELRPATGAGGGFLLPEAEIVPTAEEFRAGLNNMLLNILP